MPRVVMTSLQMLGFISVAWVLLLGLLTLTGWRCHGPWLHRTAEGLGLLKAVLSAVILMAAIQVSPEPLHANLGNWFHHPHMVFDFELMLGVTDAVYLLLAHVILILVKRYSSAYVGREARSTTFMLLLGILQLGLVLTVSAGQMQLLFLGWEMVGMASVLLIGFFVAHQAAGRQSLRALMSYKLADPGLIVAALLLHHGTGSVSLSQLAEKQSELLAHGHASVLWGVGAAIIWGSLAKGGQFPFIGWMPRAMEGPTPSSAIFYGALSVHLAPLMLIKTAPLWDWSWQLRLAVSAVGLLTAILATLMGRQQANVKSQLAYAVMAQVGLMYMEIAAGLHTLALLHLSSHAIMRTYQYLCSASVVQEFYSNGAFVRHRSHVRFLGIERLLRRNGHPRFYVHAWNGFYVEVLVQRWIITPILNAAAALHQELPGRATVETPNEIEPTAVDWIEKGA